MGLTIRRRQRIFCRYLPSLESGTVILEMKDGAYYPERSVEILFVDVASLGWLC